MRYVAIAVFGLHVLAEAVFGVRGFLTGSFSWQAGLDLGEIAPQVSGSARFLACGLLTLAMLGLAALVQGVGSQFGRIAAGLLAFFHLAGVAGVGVTALDHPDMWGTANAQGAMAIHGLLGLGFLAVLAGHRRIG